MINDLSRQQDHRPVVLCVEDEADLRRDMAEELQEAGYAVVEAANGIEALDQLEALKPDLILCDINMTGANGYEVLRALRARHPTYVDIPFVFLTALADPREVVEGKRSGADDYLVKPIDYDLMLATVESRLRQIDRIRVQRDEEIERLRLVLKGSSGADPTDWNNGIEQVLDLVAIGIVLVDQSANTRFANRAALDSSRGTLEIQHGQPVKAVAAKNRERLKHALSQISTDTPRNNDGVLAVPLERAADQRDLMVVACAISAPSNRQEACSIALFITDPDTRSSLSPSVLNTLFGLTPTEAAIALELASGKKTADIAVKLGVAATTIAFHMRNLFQKTNTNRQAELVALLLAGPATLPSHTTETEVQSPERSARS